MKQSALIIPISNHQLKFILKLSIQFIIVGEEVVYCSAHWILSQVVQIRDLAGSMCCVRYLSPHCVSLFSGLKIGTSQFPGKPDKMLGGNLAMEWYPSHPGKSSNTSLHVTWKPRTSSSWMGH